MPLLNQMFAKLSNYTLKNKFIIDQMFLVI